MNKSKIKLGANPLLFPLSTVIAGTLINDKPNFITVSYIGIVQHQPAMLAVTLIDSHFTNEGISKNDTRPLKCVLGNKKGFQQINKI
jgi:flavin reductase (DIM6/NTAB) family NADH-FMN oxidoreductase RutF